MLNNVNDEDPDNFESVLKGSTVSPIDEFEQWFRSKGGFLHPNVGFKYSDEKGVHVQALASIPVGTVVISCPHSITLSALNTTGRLAAFPGHCPDGFSFSSLPPEVMSVVPRAQSLAAVWLCLHKQLGHRSFWFSYINTLPSLSLGTVEDDLANGQGSIDTPLCWSDDEKEWISGSPLEKGVKDLELFWRTEWDEWASRIALWAKSFDIGFDWQHYHWALTMLGSRAFSSATLAHVPGPGPYPNLTSLFDPDALLYPGTDMLNHSPTTLNRWEYDENGLSIVLNDTVKPGDEIFNTYGVKNNSQLMLSYGFALAGNPHNAFSLKSTASPSENAILTSHNQTPTIQNSGQTELLQPNSVTRDRPRVVPEPVGPDNATFYLRPAEQCKDLPGYIASGPFAGIPAGLLNRLTATLATPRERAYLSSHKPTKPSLLVMHQLGARNYLDVLSLLSLRVDAELLRLQPAITQIPSATDADPRRTDRRQRAWTYMTGLFILLNEHRERLHDTVARVLNPAGDTGLFVRLGAALIELDDADSGRTLLRSIMRGAAAPISLDESASAASRRDAIHAFISQAQDDGAEDVWAVYVGLVITGVLSPVGPLSSRVTEWVAQVPDAPSHGLDADELDELVTHFGIYLEGGRGRTGDAKESSDVWASKLWSSTLVRRICYLIRTETVSAERPERPGKKEVVLVTDVEYGAAVPWSGLTGTRTDV